MSAALNIGRAAVTATLLAPPLAWGTFFLTTNQDLSGTKSDGILAMLLVLIGSIMITGAGILLIAVPFSVAFNRIVQGRFVTVFLMTTLVGAVLAWLLARQEDQ